MDFKTIIMKKILFAAATFVVLAFTSCYVSVRESRPRPKRATVIIQGSENTPKDSLQSASDVKTSQTPAVPDTLK
jgi:hypothetical protein